MFSQQAVLSLLALTGLASASALMPRACGETAAKVCFGRDGGQAQDILLDDLQYVADYLRHTGESAEPGPTARWTMPSGFDCAEWTVEVPGAGSVLLLAKHINPRITSSVLYADMADTIDGGVDGTEAAKAASLMGCGTGGGMLGVKTNATNPAYNTDEYKVTKAKPEGIILKVVKAAA